MATRARSRRGGRRDGRAIAHRRHCGRRRRGCAWRERRKDSARHWDPRGTRQRGASRRVVAAGPLWQRAGRAPADPLARLRLNVNQEDATLLGAMASTHLHALHTHRAQLLDWTCRRPSLPAEAGRRVLAALMPLVPLGADFGRHLLLLLRKLLSHLRHVHAPWRCTGSVGCSRAASYPRSQARRPPPPHTSPSPPRVPGTARAPPCSSRVIRQSSGCASSASSARQTRMRNCRSSTRS